jgi:hypothetical protein
MWKNSWNELGYTPENLWNDGKQAERRCFGRMGMLPVRRYYSHRMRFEFFNSYIHMTKKKRTISATLFRRLNG